MPVCCLTGAKSGLTGRRGDKPLGRSDPQFAGDQFWQESVAEGGEGLGHPLVRLYTTIERASNLFKSVDNLVRRSDNLDSMKIFFANRTKDGPLSLEACEDFLQ